MTWSPLARYVSSVRVHVDTDFGGDPDDACALAMLLGWPGIELVGITTSLEHLGQRADCVAHVLRLAARTDIPVAAGSSRTLTGGEYRPATDNERYWPKSVTSAREGHESYDFIELLDASVTSGATIVAIGGFTNLAMLELARPGVLANTNVVAMNGWFESPDVGFPQWGPAFDFNTQVDTHAAEIVTAATSLTLVPVPIAMRATLKARHLDRLRTSGSLGRLLAEQSEAHCEDNNFGELARDHPRLPTDLINFHWDPLTAAIAVGWNGAQIERRAITTATVDDVFRFVNEPMAKRRRGVHSRMHSVVTAFDESSFDETFLAATEHAQREEREHLRRETPK